MENVKFVRSEEEGRVLYLYFKIHDRVGTKCGMDREVYAYCASK
jgi:hypothetical protein